MQKSAFFARFCDILPPVAMATAKNATFYTVIESLGKILYFDTKLAWLGPFLVVL